MATDPKQAFVHLSDTQISRICFSVSEPHIPLAETEMILWVPLKTALKRENEIAASDTRKADEAGLAPG